MALGRAAVEAVGGQGTAPAGATVLVARPGEAVPVPGRFLIEAQYERRGSDLLLTGKDGSTVLVRDFFDLADPPDLVNGEGATIAADLAAALARAGGPVTYAQARPVPSGA
ncbi:MAG: hypothetical protein ACT4P2_10145, partial [Pseudomonadota bacterium]